MLNHRHYLWASLALLITVVLCPLPAGWSAGWHGELLNRMHAPLMAMFGYLAGIYLGPGSRNHTLILTLILILIAAATIELVQPWFGRTASLGDFGWGMIGALSVIIRHLGALPTKIRHRRCLMAFAAVTALAPPASWWLQLSLARQDAACHFPALLAPTSHSASLLWHVSPAFSDHEGKILLGRNERQPTSARLEVMEKDWSAFSGLDLEGELLAPAELPLGVRLDMTNAQRIQMGAIIQPGENHLQIFWPEGIRPSSVKQLVLFLEAGRPPAKLRIHSVRLIKQGR